MQHCSHYWGLGEGCFGVLWVEENGDCWIKNSSVSATSIEPTPGRYTALVERSEMDGFDTACPHADLSTDSLPGVHGMEYTTHCGRMINADNACFDGYPCLQGAYTAFHHAETLEECMAICLDQHPFCTAVSWNPGLEIGFANCIPKTSDASGYSDGDDVRGGPILFHSASMTQIDQIDTKYPGTDTYTVGNATDAKCFDVHCGRLNPGTNITSLHTQNVTACMNACASSDRNCKAILFDSTLTGGFNNCYLQNTTSVISDQASATYAVLIDAAISSSAVIDSHSAPSTSKAWIAGPVVGSIAALAAIGFAIFWWRRKKASRAAGREKGGNNEGGVAYEAVPAYSTNVDLENVGASELPASTKYAHNHRPRSPAQELPS